MQTIVPGEGGGGGTGVGVVEIGRADVDRTSSSWKLGCPTDDLGKAPARDGLGNPTQGITSRISIRRPDGTTPDPCRRLGSAVIPISPASNSSHLHQFSSSSVRSRGLAFLPMTKSGPSDNGVGGSVQEMT